MEVDNSRVLRSRHKAQPPAKQITPVTVKKSVSVSALFNKPQHGVEGDNIKVVKPPPKPKAKQVSDDRAQSLRSRSSSRSPHEAGSRIAKKKSVPHPLAAVFNDTSDNYRRHLYKTTTLKINTTLEKLVNSLYDDSLQVLTSDLNNKQGSPIRLTIPAKFERAALKLYAPISAYKIGLTRTNTDGTHTKFPATMESRMSDYAHLVASQKAEIEKLRDKWNTIVGEIWKVGVQCLGEEVVESMLFTTQRKGNAQEVSSSPAEAESTLFVLDQETSPPRRAARGKKRVTFATTVEAEEDFQRTSEGPLYFLYQPTRLRVGPVPDGPAMPVQEIRSLETRIKGLGQEEYAELKKAEMDYKAYWQKKNKRLAQVFGED